MELPPAGGSDSILPDAAGVARHPQNARGRRSGRMMHLRCSHDAGVVAMKTKTAAEAPPLTEAQLLAMPEDDYMNTQQLEFFRALLERMREEIFENGLA